MRNRNQTPFRYWPGALLIAVAMLIGATACSSRASGAPIPPDLHLGEDVCEFCNMIISEERFAAGYLTADGDEVIFDDIGDMVQHHLEQQAAVEAFFVHDHDDHTWIRAETATYVHSPELVTPMLSGLAAFSTEQEAKQFAAEADGETLTFEELLARYQN